MYKSSTPLFIVACLCLFAGATSCYRFPTENDYSLIPSTNNRDFTGEGNGANKLPTVGY